MGKIFVLILLVVLFLFIQDKQQSVPVINTTEALYELYYKVNNTPPSNTHKKELSQIIKNRLDCYAKNPSYTWRFNVCLTEYTEAIVLLGRQNFYSSPTIGNFIETVNICPIIYNMCPPIETTERCLEFERQCIDFAFDNSWRGSSSLLLRSYRNN